MPTISGHDFDMRDFVKETTQTSGTGSYSLDGVSFPEEGHQSFLEAVGDGNKTLYTVKRGSTWEKAIGTVSAGAPVTLSRDLILGTSVDDSLGADPIDWTTTDPKDIWIGAPSHLLNMTVDPQRVTDLETRITELNGQLDAFAGNKMLFVQASIPAGWIQDTTRTDRLLRIVDDGTGGTNGGNWTISGIAVDGHALTFDEMPAHTHSIPLTASGVPTASGVAGGFSGGQGGSDTSSGAGSNHTHTHSLTIGSGWRPLYQNAIVCTVDDWLQAAP